VSEDPDADAFGKLADRTRVDILTGLDALETPAAYADVFEESGVEDRGRFNYHLRALRDHYVEQSTAGYELTQAGRHALNALAAGHFEAPTGGELCETDSPCGRCGGPVRVGYRTGEVVVRCPGCERTLTRYDFPARTAKRLATVELLDAYDAWTRRQFALVDDGVCPFCASPTTTELVAEGTSAHVSATCGECPASLSAPLGLVILARPRIAGALEARGVDLDGARFWEFPWCQFDAPELVSADPLRVELVAGSGDDPIRVVVDDAVESVTVDR
jgi:hypothetical protein